jgi:hypothetical protein
MKRSELRYACYRAKGDKIAEDVDAALELVNSVRQPFHHWSGFAQDWDILVDSTGAIKIIKPETDYDTIHNVLLEAALYAKQGVDFDSFTDAQQNIITQVEILMLDKIMTWQNYNRVWGVEVDIAMKQIKTKLYNLKASQYEVTEDMIRASTKDADGSAFIGEQPVENVLEAKVMDAAEKKLFEEFLAKKYGKK